MKKILSVMAVSAFVLTAGVALAGGPGKKADGCPAACQQQIDDLNSSQAQQNEQLGAHGKQLANHEGRITTLEKNAYNPWYVRAGVRASWLSADVTAEFASTTKEVSSDVGFGGALAVGRQFGQFRAELELAHQKTDFSYTDVSFGKVSGDVSLSTVMANAYYEIPVADAFAVYGMAGVGYGKFSGNGTGFSDGAFRYDNDANVIAYKIGAGVTYNFADNMAADLGYEYLGTTDPGTTTSSTNFNSTVKDVDSHNVVASFRFKF